MLDCVREVLDSARGALLLRRVLRRRVRLREVRDDDLRVTLGTEGTRLQQGLLEKDAALIHVQTYHGVRLCRSILTI